MDVYLGGKRLYLDPSMSIGKGGEADVFDIGKGKVAKIFKQADHPDLVGLVQEQQAAMARIADHQKKLRAFPKKLPSRVVAPIDLLTDKSGKQILGFTMPFLKGTEVLLKYSDRSYRQGITNNSVTKIFKDMHETIRQIHQAGVVIGDFNDLNILVSQNLEAYFIDADSFQFESFLCKVFTAKFVDPLHCDPKQTSLNLIKPHTPNTDWYAFNIMLMQCLLFVGPYGGVYKPKDLKKKVPHDARPLHRITVFHPEVKYPKPAISYKILPDELLDYFYQVFLKDRRGEFPNTLLNMEWVTCSCGLEFAKKACPVCNVPVPGAIKQTTVVRGNVTSTQIFKTSGHIVYAAIQNGELRWIYHENKTFKRETGSTIISGELDPLMRFGVQNNKTLIALTNQLLTLEPGRPSEKLHIDTYRNVPVFQANENHLFWLDSGKLQRTGKYAPDLIGNVLSGQTLFWVGPAFGFGFYRAGKLSVAFVFDAIHGGLNDTVKMPPIRGQLIDCYAYFTKEKVWFLVSFQEAGNTKNRCCVIKADGSVEATEECSSQDGSWLGNIRGKAAAGNWLFSPTDEGICRLEISQGKIVKGKEFPDTEPFVNENSQLFPSSKGIYVVGEKDIKLIQIK